MLTKARAQRHMPTLLLFEASAARASRFIAVIAPARVALMPYHECSYDGESARY